MGKPAPQLRVGEQRGFADDVNCDIERKPADECHAVRPSELIVGTAALLPAAIKIAREMKEKKSA